MCRMVSLGFSVFFYFVVVTSIFFSPSLQAVMEISAGSESRVEINTSLLSTAEKDVYHTSISICSREATEYLYITFGYDPYWTDDFSVKSDVSDVRQEYHLRAELNRSKIDVTPNQHYKFNIKNNCESASRDDLKLTLKFYGLGRLQPGTYSGKLWVFSSTGRAVLEIPITISGEKEIIKISNLNDLAFQKGNGQWIAQNDQICVYSTAKNYRLEAYSSNKGRVQNIHGEGAEYSAFWAVGGGEEQDLTGYLGGGAGALKNLKPDNSENCPTLRSRLRVSVPAASISQLPAGMDSDIITLTVIPG